MCKNTELEVNKDQDGSTTMAKSICSHHIYLDLLLHYLTTWVMKRGVALLGTVRPSCGPGFAAFGGDGRVVEGSLQDLDRSLGSSLGIGSGSAVPQGEVGGEFRIS